MQKNQQYHGLKSINPKAVAFKPKQKKPANKTGSQPSMYPKGRYPA